MYVLAPNQTVEKFPYSIKELKKENPQTSFPENLTNEVLAEFNVFPVVSVGAQQHDPITQIATQDNCVFNSDLQRWETAWTIRDKTTDEIAEEQSIQAAKVREERNKLLTESDWTQLPDSPVDKTAWALHRQALRDITDQMGFPWNITWPTKPE